MQNNKQNWISKSMKINFLMMTLVVAYLLQVTIENFNLFNSG